MAYPPTQLTVTWSGGSDTLTIPSGVSFNDYIQGIMRFGYFYPQNAAANPPASLRFVPASQISEIDAQ